MVLSVEAREELLFWQDNLVALNGRDIRINQVPIQVNCQVAGDASGAGLYLGDSVSRSTLLSLPFSEEEQLKSSTWKELCILELFYTSPGAARYSGRTVLHLTDNVNVRQIVKKGSKQMELAEMSRRVFLACRKMQITLIVNWESREAEVMKEVDAGSRGPWLLQDEFQLDFDSIFMILSRLNLLN